MKKTATPAFGFLPSIADFLFLVVLVFLFFSDRTGLLHDGDTGYHIRAGEHIVDTLSIPRTDLFSFHTPPLPWTAHEWLSEVVMALVHRSLGLTGVVALFSVLLALTSYLLFRALRAYRCDLLIAAAVTVFALGVSKIHWLARPHVFSLLFMIGWHYALESWRRGGRDRLFLLPPSMLLWVNLHGGFLGGFILLGCYLAGELWGRAQAPGSERAGRLARAKRLCAVTLAALAASLVNPFGYRILLFPFRLVSNSYLMDHVQEFLSPDFHEMAAFKYLLLLTVALCALSRTKPEPAELLLLLVFGDMALYSARYIPLFALVAAPTLARQAAEARGVIGGRALRFLKRRSLLIARIDAAGRGYLWPALALAVVALAAGPGGVRHGFDPKTKPVAATEFLMRERIPGRVFNNDEFGDYLIYRAYPSYRVFFDGRSDMYGTAMMKEYNTVAAFEPGWERVLEKYRIAWIFLDAGSPLTRHLATDAGWVRIYADAVASIFVRNSAENRSLIARYRPPRPWPG